MVKCDVGITAALIAHARTPGSPVFAEPALGEMAGFDKLRRPSSSATGSISLAGDFPRVPNEAIQGHVVVSSL